MTIQEIKAEISAKAGFTLGTLALQRQFDKRPLQVGETVTLRDGSTVVFDAANPTKEVDGIVTPWLSHWDNDHRVRVTFPEEVALKLKAEPNKADLAYKYEEVKPADKPAYKRFIIITPKNIEFTF